MEGLRGGAAGDDGGGRGGQADWGRGKGGWGALVGVLTGGVTAAWAAGDEGSSWVGGQAVAVSRGQLLTALPVWVRNINI